MRRLSLALAVVLVPLVSACATTGAVPKPFPTPGRTPDSPPSAAPVPRTTPNMAALVSTAMDLRGTPYRNGGTAPDGFDCSGFTQHVFAQHGVKLPRETRDQFGVGEVVRLDEALPGDLLFFTTTAPGASHVGIAIGGGEFVHAPNSTGVVRVEAVAASYWARRFLGARRITPP